MKIVGTAFLFVFVGLLLYLGFLALPGLILPFVWFPPALAFAALVGTIVFRSEWVLTRINAAPSLFVYAFRLLQIMTFLMMCELLGLVVIGLGATWVANETLTNKSSAPLAAAATVLAGLIASVGALFANAFSYLSLDHAGKWLIKSNWDATFPGGAAGPTAAAYDALNSPDWSSAGARNTARLIATARMVALGRATHSIRLRISAEVAPATDIRLRVAAIDAAGGVDTAFAGHVQLQLNDPNGVIFPPVINIVPAENGSQVVTMRFTNAGHYNVRAADQLDTRIYGDGFVNVT